jgi:adenylosuccinate synthase
MRHTVVVDLGYGDAGKGTVVDMLCAANDVRAVVRFNGGAQAAHNVVLPDGRHHTFAQFGSGTLRGVPTHLSRFMVVDPVALAGEAGHLARLGVRNPFGLLSVDRNALLATPWHKVMNQRREAARGSARHGSCGMGVGETVRYALDHPGDAPRAGDPPALLERRLTLLRDRLGDGVADGTRPRDVMEAFLGFQAAVSIVDGLGDLLDEGPCVFEGAQGVLLDEWRGWHPYTTWSTTTFDNALALLRGRPAEKLGVVRTYTPRHGNGPLVTEDPALAGLLPERYNGDGPWQGPFRIGHFDAVAHRYAIEVCGGVDSLAVTHLDVTSPAMRICHRYRSTDRIVPGLKGDLAYTEALGRWLLGERPILEPAPADWVAAIQDTLGAPVTVESWGPTCADKVVRAPSTVAGCA